ncbi:PREDICTED: ATP-binding cassette sub-family A member 9-like isoform X2 [Calidris pugnax]|uniref:ATP-binding cassette sub-family A member 9-like isoform X1 n=1 Tax=Calidris pugnax TaxID=198806 RepID=UPI00071E58AA|nr:PREDICTED: ATP-binding cassette sub-family A member 9-like isoform X1 [Calidris pugnax]XP_014807761.1 PREDICTED: ATP-binding cassette sub-family A member 9-like isoform X2 [Calidris pugnax]
MAIGLRDRTEPTPAPPPEEEPRHLGAGGDTGLMENTSSAGKMQGIFKRASKIFRQTRVLLWKNILLVWRMKTESFQEWITSVILLLIIQASSNMVFHHPRQEVPYVSLGRLDDPAFNATGVTLAYTPVTNTTRQIMSHVAADSALTGIIIEEVESEKKLETIGFEEEDVIGVVFKDDFSYRLRFQHDRVVPPDDAFEHIDTCYNFSSSYCEFPLYWHGGFLSVQSSIDAALIQVKTNHSVWEEMKSISGVHTKSPLIKPVYKMGYIWFIIYIIFCFSPYMYFLSVKVIREKKQLKVLMRAMGLQDIAFWLSWSLLYSVYISITASLLTLITIREVTHVFSFFEIYFFYFFYGIASIHFCFMLSSLLKQPNIASFVGFVLHIIFGLLGFLTLFEKLPVSLEWIFNLFSPFAFTAGFSKMVKFEKYGPAFAPDLYPFFTLYITLTLDSVLYLLLAIYFDKVLPGKYGVPYPPSFFLRPSFWFQPRSGYVGVQGVSGSSHHPILSNNIEPMPPGFDGKEAIRLNNIKKLYKKKDKRTEALRGLSFSIYEGQITALLGHSGSGKTALLNVLSGFSKPSAGSATIYNYKVSEVQDMEGIQAMVGICPQFNLHFEALTVKENLRIFAHIRGIQQKEVEQEVQKVLVMLDLTDLQDVHANTLSGGQKRKLSLGIAILGNPQVLLLDEPTAGLDPCSRHHVWSLLKERQAGRVTLFTTQSMEEADAHADRKAFLSNGRLQCVGSSLYLKRKWGIGYHLRMSINEVCDTELTSSLVRQYVPGAVLAGQKQGELGYLLPLENTDSFPDLFSHLESSLLQGVVNYEVSRTTLEDVFLKLEGEEAIGQEEDGDLEERDQSLLVFSEQGSVELSGMALWRQQVCALTRVRFLKLKHEGKFLRSILLFFGMFILPMLVIFIGFQLWDSSSNWEITASSYFLPTAEKIQNKSTNLLILNDTGAEIEDFIAALKAQNIIPEITLEKNITSIPLHNGALKISLEGKSYRFTVMCSVEPINCFPVLLNILSNSFLRLFNSTACIRVWSEPFYGMQNAEIKSDIFFICLSYLLILAAGLPPHFAVSSMEDYKLQARAQLRLAGLFPSAYWCGQALVDIPLFWTLVGLMLGIMLLFNRICPLQASAVLLLIVCLVGYGVSLVLLVYLIAFQFRMGRSNRYIWSFIFILVNFTLYMISDLHDALYFTFSTLIPVFPPLGWLIFSTPRFSSFHTDLLESWNHIFVAVFAPYIHCVIFAFLLRCLEMRYGEAVTRLDPIFRVQRRRAVPHQNRDLPGEEAPEVHAERERVRSTMGSLHQEEDSVIVVNSLRKEYVDKKASSILKKKKKVAVKNLSFSVKKGEILGLLGPNGAGKSTTINMISGDVAVTAGEVLLKGWGAATSPPGCLGCCPQRDPLWPDLTVLQHLEVYAALRGMWKEEAPVHISRVAKALDLQKHLETPARRLSAGEARKLSFALSVLGDPRVMLWDEPSVSMDLRGQRRMWRVIQAAVKGKERAGVLSTQYLEEAEAMCDRVAILVSGQLRYIGSLEDLKRKFGTSYHLEVKMMDTGQSDALHAEILRLFPRAARQERTASLLIYKIPMEDALPLSQSFSKLEAAKQNFRLEEYSLSLHTLQQAFLDLTQDLEEHDLDAASNRAVEQRPLHL